MRLAIRVKPGASRTAVGGHYAAGRYAAGQHPSAQHLPAQHAAGERGQALVVSVSARAVDGKATEAALRAIAEAFGVRRRDVRLVAGAASRDKIVDIEGDDGHLAALREEFLGA